jgi:lipopolysaccharide export system ATP-binding protein
VGYPVAVTRPLFAADSISRSFGELKVLSAASVWAVPGRITALLGRNGCGKTTLLRIGAGTLAADAGVVHFDGEAYLRPRLHRLARLGLYYLPQDRVLSNRWTLGQHLDALRWRFPHPNEPAVLDRLGLAELLDHFPDELSGGERRRAAIAIAMLRRPRCLLADEPFVGINPTTAEQVAAALREMAGAGCAIVITGHEVRQLMAVAHDVVWMVAGTTHGLGAPESALRHDQFRREYLGPVPTV